MRWSEFHAFDITTNPRVRLVIRYEVRGIRAIRKINSVWRLVTRAMFGARRDRNDSFVANTATTFRCQVRDDSLQWQFSVG